ncbi:MAG: MarR family transcriptional regulator [Pseudomonadota bacterium]
MSLRADEIETGATGGRVPSMGEIGLNQFDPYLLNRISARWNADMSEILKSHGLSTARMRALAVLSVSPGLTINELAVYAVTEQSTLSRNLDAMEEQGLIVRRMRAADARVREIHLTEKGRETFAAFWPDMHGLFDAMFQGISPEEHRAFTGTLQKILANIRHHDL